MILCPVARSVVSKFKVLHYDIKVLITGLKATQYSCTVTGHLLLLTCWVAARGVT